MTSSHFPALPKPLEEIKEKDEGESQECEECRFALR